MKRRLRFFMFLIFHSACWEDSKERAAVLQEQCCTGEKQSIQTVFTTFTIGVFILKPAAISPGMCAWTSTFFPDCCYFIWLWLNFRVSWRCARAPGLSLNTFSACTSDGLGCREQRYRAVWQPEVLKDVAFQRLLGLLYFLQYLFVRCGHCI